MEVPLKRIPKLVLAQFYMRNPFTLRLIAKLPPRKLDRPIFIIGVPRSGTSVFCNLFAMNPGVAHWSEAPTVWDPKHRDQEVDHRWTEAEATPATIRRIENNFAYFAWLKGKPRFVNKHPRNALRIPFLMAGWPEALIIHIERDLRAVVNSLITETHREKWRQRFPLGAFARPEDWRRITAIPDEVERFSEMAAATHRTLSADLARCVPARQLRQVRYEDFAQDCRGELRECWKFAALPEAEGALARAPEDLENRNFKWATKRSAAELETMRRLLTPILIETEYEKDGGWVERIGKGAVARATPESG